MVFRLGNILFKPVRKKYFKRAKQ